MEGRRFRRRSLLLKERSQLMPIDQPDVWLRVARSGICAANLGSNELKVRSQNDCDGPDEAHGSLPCMTMLKEKRLPRVIGGQQQRSSAELLRSAMVMSLSRETFPWLSHHQ